MSVRLQRIDLNVVNTRTRMPFRYGIASMTAVPHLFVTATVSCDGVSGQGIAADGLAPKWFTKDADSSIRADIEEMIEVIRAAADHALAVGEAATVFDFWQQVYQAQQAWGGARGYPPLLWAFGVTLVERAMIDAHCRATGTRFADAVRRNTLGIRLGHIHSELGDVAPADLLPESPRTHMHVRHTVGLGDAIWEDELTDGVRVDDGLPQSLAACIAAQGLTHFKVKLCGDRRADFDRLESWVALIQGMQRCCFTLDGNEQYNSVDAFREAWEEIADLLMGEDRFLECMLFVEQPLHRSVALDADTAAELLAWEDRPPMIIDESDGDLDTCRRALASGYRGTSHKNCKGVFKGIANACLVARRNRIDPNAGLLISGEDLCNIGPVALTQDLAVAATLGLNHVERNGHHYFKGLDMFPADVQEAVAACHGDLYQRDAGGAVRVDVRGGRIRIASVIEAPFGRAIELDTARFTALDEWKFESLGL
jgi:hypothetical protein